MSGCSDAFPAISYSFTTRYVWHDLEGLRAKYPLTQAPIPV